MRAFSSKLSIVFFYLFSVLAVAQEFTAKKIIEKNIQLTGGMAQWKQLNSILLKGTLVLGVKDKYPIKIYQARPNLTKTIITINSKDYILEGYNGEKAYLMDYETKMLRENSTYVVASFETDFIDYERKGFVAKLIGEEKINGEDAFKIEFTKNLNKTIYYFSKKTYFLLREVKDKENIIYSNFKKVGNLIMPFRIEEISQKNSNYIILINKISLNKIFSKNMFKF